MSAPPPTWYPSGDDELLLRAALWRDERGVAAWTALRPRLDIDTVHHEAVKLLPLVHRSLAAMGVDDPDMGRMKGLHRHHWYTNQRLLQRIGPVLDALADAGVPTMALKGVPLGLTCYDDLGVRPMADLDLLVPFDRFRDAASVIDGCGFTGDPITKPDLRYFHSRQCDAADGTQIDLHFVVHEALGLRGISQGWHGDFWATPVDRDEFWTRAEPLRVGGADTCAPGATDLLFHVLVHGVGHHSGARLRWIADAVTLLGARGDEVDWQLVVEQAQRRHVVLALRDTLDYLDRSGFAAVPADVLPALRAAPVTRRDRWVYSIYVDPMLRGGRLQSVRWVADRFVCATAQEPLPTAVAALPSFLAWDAERRRDVPVKLAKRVSRGVTKALTR